MRLIVLVALAVLLAAVPAQASFPGSNGPFVVALNEGCEIGIDLFRIPAGGGTPAKLTDACATEDEDGGGTFYAPDASPDGSTLLFRTDRLPSGFASIPVAGGTVTEVKAPDDLSTHSPSPPSWSPDGEHFAAEADLYQGGYDHGSLFDVPADGGAATVTVKQPSCPSQPRFCSTFENPRWSPNGKLLAVEVSTPKVKPGLRNSLKPGIWVLNADTGRPIRRVAKRGLEIDWSPNSKYLVYRTNYQQREIKGGASGGNIFIVDAKGRKTRALVHKEDIADTQPTFAPDGRSVAFVELRFSAGDVGFTVKPSLWTIRVRKGRATGKPKRIQKLASPNVEEGFYSAPDLTWAPKP